MSTYVSSTFVWWIEPFFKVAAQAERSFFPVAVDPVNVNFLTNGLLVNSGPISSALPVITFRTPGGIPAFSASFAKAKAEKGVAEAGLTMIVQPAARAGPTLRVIIADGKFQGVTAAHTPTGCLRTKSLLSA